MELIFRQEKLVEEFISYNRVVGETAEKESKVRTTMRRSTLAQGALPGLEY